MGMLRPLPVGRRRTASISRPRAPTSARPPRSFPRSLPKREERPGSSCPSCPTLGPLVADVRPVPDHVWCFTIIACHVGRLQEVEGQIRLKRAVSLHEQLRRDCFLCIPPYDSFFPPFFLFWHPEEEKKLFLVENREQSRHSSSKSLHRSEGLNFISSGLRLTVIWL